MNTIEINHPTNQPNFTVVSFCGYHFYFSYKTVIAFHDGRNQYVSENQWGTTTGKHLDKIDGGKKKDRMPRGLFEEKLNNFLTRLSIGGNQMMGKD
jgi:hypothetical protein